MTESNNKSKIIIILVVGAIIVFEALGIVLPELLTSTNQSDSVQKAEQVSDDTDKETLGEDVNFGIINYYASHFAYPSSINYSNGKLFASDGSVLVEPTSADDLKVINKTQFCYGYVNDSEYRFGVKLSTGLWFDFGNANSKCTDSNIVR